MLNIVSTLPWIARDHCPGPAADIVVVQDSIIGGRVSGHDYVVDHVDEVSDVGSGRTGTISPGDFITTD